MSSADGGRYQFAAFACGRLSLPTHNSQKNLRIAFERLAGVDGHQDTDDKQTGKGRERSTWCSLVQFQRNMWWSARSGGLYSYC